MAQPTVYLETTVIGYATTRPSQDLIVAAHQQITREWLAHGPQEYELFVSQLVIREASSGDEEAVRERLALVEGITLLAITDAVGELLHGSSAGAWCQERPRKTRSTLRLRLSTA